VQATAIAQPGTLLARLQQPVLTIAGLRPLIGRRDRALQQRGHAEPLGHLPGPAAVL